MSYFWRQFLMFFGHKKTIIVTSKMVIKNHISVFNWVTTSIKASTHISLINLWSQTYQFWKIPPSTKINPPSPFIDFLDFFHPPLLVYKSYVLVFSIVGIFHKIPSSTFIPTTTFSDLATFASPPRLLERWEYSTKHAWAFERYIWEQMIPIEG